MQPNRMSRKSLGAYACLECAANCVLSVWAKLSYSVKKYWRKCLTEKLADLLRNSTKAKDILFKTPLLCKGGEMSVCVVGHTSLHTHGGRRTIFRLHFPNVDARD